MADLPNHVTIVEEGPREGFQSEARTFPLAERARFIEALAATGLGEINCCSFVDPKRVPQMADSETLARTVQRRPGTRYVGLWLNDRGFQRARATPLDLDGILIASASETFGKRNNNRDRAELLTEQRRMLEAYKDAGVKVGGLYVFTAFGCNYEGDVPLEAVMGAAADLITLCAEHDIRPSHLYLCDTVGAANPRLVEKTVGAVRERWPDMRIGLHLHDTRGLGLANASAGLRLGVDRFDASCAGLGGCPFAANRAAAGNICTEDFAFMCEEMGVATGIDVEALVDCARSVESLVGHPLPGKLMKAGTLSKFRSH